MALFPIASVSCLALADFSLPNQITYATRMDAVTWSYSGSKFSCQISHVIDDFGVAVFEREAGETTNFELQSQNPRLSSGKAALVSHPPVWLTTPLPYSVAKVEVNHSNTPVVLKRKLSEKMLAELQKGRDLRLIKDPWYGDKEALTVIIRGVGFKQTHQEYLNCLSGLLPVNFSQIEKKSLYYDRDDSDLSGSVKRYLDKVIAYLKEDPSVRTVYIDGHTDSEGIRSDNMLQSKSRAERVTEYLLTHGIEKDRVITRWHGERYQVSTNRTLKGRAKNRRVTIRLSKIKAEPVIAEENSSNEVAEPEKKG